MIRNDVQYNVFANYIIVYSGGVELGRYYYFCPSKCHATVAQTHASCDTVKWGSYLKIDTEVTY